MKAQKKGHIHGSGNNTNICFNCQKACGGCSWTEIDPKTDRPRFAPVPGWTAKEVLLNIGNHGGKNRVLQTYHITACPEYVQDENRKPSGGEFTEEQLKHLMRKWKRMGEL